MHFTLIKFYLQLSHLFNILTQYSYIYTQIDIHTYLLYIYNAPTLVATRPGAIATGSYPITNEFGLVATGSRQIATGSGLVTIDSYPITTGLCPVATGLDLLQLVAPRCNWPGVIFGRHVF